MKEKTKNIDYYYFLLAFIVIILISIIVGTDFLFGSKTDWINQHTAFPDYFRKLFYQTGELIPNFAPQIGAGQNIFHFSYYGLLNPFILISYLFSMISMTDYLIAINIILILSTVFLLYYFLKQHISNHFCCFISTILILLSASFLFQFHRHFMFVSYIPFLIIGLLGIDHYFTKGTKWIYCLATFFMIMTSYYYSIIGIFIFILYGIYHYIKRTNHLSIKSFFQIGLPFLIPIIVGILMASILLLPTAYVILNSRGGEHLAVTFADLFLPKINIDAFVYDTYALGLTAISIIASLYLLQKKEYESRFLILSIFVVALFPIFIYLLNGTLYIRNKIFIPFLPLFALFIAKFLQDLFQNKIEIPKLTFLVIIILLISYIFGYHNIIFYVDIFIILISLWIYSKWHFQTIVIIALLITAGINFGGAVQKMNLIPKQFYNEIFSKEKDEMIHKILEQEQNIVRFSNLDYTLYNINKIYEPYYYQTSLYSSTYHNNYNTFFKDTMKQALPYRNKLILAQNDNIMFQSFMGIKYVLSSHTPSLGYQEIMNGKQNKNLKVYKNQNVLPIGFATSNLLNEKYFNSLNYPVTNEALLHHIIVSNKGKQKFNSNINKFKAKPKIISKDDSLIIKKSKYGYTIQAKKTSTLKLSFEHQFDNEILFLTFQLKNQNTCNDGDQQIKINHVSNKLTCKEWQYQNNNHTFHYVLSQNKKWNELVIEFQKGNYEIKDINTHILNYESITNSIQSFDPFVIDKKNSKGNHIVGKIDVKNDGYFATTIPYDKGFHVKIDKKEINYEKVNTTFLGFPIKKGNHTIEITYQSPFIKIGYITSVIGLVSFIILCLSDYKKFKNK